MQLHERQAIHERHNLPQPRTSFVGRVEALAEVGRLLPTTRLLTIVGSGGGGKTRLALEAAEAALDAFPDGVWWVDLSALNDGALLPQTVAAALGLREDLEHSPAELVREYLCAHQALLVLDNCEHVRAACAELLGPLEPAAARARVLATSREALHVTGEQVWQLPLLELPPAGQAASLEQLAATESVSLFLERARTVAPGFKLSERNADAVALICRRLEGLPLAIELAAARCTVLTPATIAERLENSVGLLTRGAHGSDARHRMLRAAIDWSFDLLDEQEQALFVRLATFRGGFDLSAAEGICSGDGLADGEVLDLLAALVEKSLVVAAELGNEMRYRLLEPIRHYAAERLARSEAAEGRHERHAAYYLELAKRAEAKFHGSEQPAWIERLDREHDNALAALAWCTTAGRIELGMRLSSALLHYWVVRGYVSLGLRWFDRLLAAGDGTVAPEVRVAALNTDGYLLYAHSDFQRARVRYEQSLALAQRSQDHAGVEAALNGLGVTLWSLGDFVAAREYLEQAIALCVALNDRHSLAGASGNLGLVHQFAGRMAEARACYEQTLSIAREAGNLTIAATTLMNLGNLASQSGDYAAAKLCYAEALAANRELGNALRTADTLLNLGQFSAGLGEQDVALEHYAEAERMYLALNSQADLGYIYAGRADIAFQRGGYEQAREAYERALSLFRAAGNQRLVGRALGNLGYIAVREGRLKDAATLCAEALALRRSIGHSAGMIFSLDSGYIELALALGRPAVAARLLGAADAAREQLGRPRPPAELRAADAIRATLRSQLGEVNVAALVNEGRAMGLPQAAAYAQDSLAPSVIEQPAPELRIFALGPLRVYRGDRLLSSADWTYAKAREIVLLLLCRQHATREQIGAELWPEASTEQVRQRFSAALAHARNALGRENEWISLGGGRYSFNRTQAVWFDVDAFESGLFEAQLLQRNGKEDERAAGLLAEAVALYSGDFASDVVDGEWHVARREALRHAFLEALMALGQLHARAGRDEQAVAVLQRAIEADAYFEEAYHEIIRAYARLGKRRQAFAQYGKLQAALAELHAEPSPETMALIEHLQHGEPL